MRGCRSRWLYSIRDSTTLCRQVAGELFAITTKYYPYNNASATTGAVPEYMPEKMVSSWDIDMDYNVQPNYIPRSRRNPFLQDYPVTHLKF